MLTSLFQVNFPFISSNITASPAYGVYISQLVHYSRACAQYSDFLDWARLLTQKLLEQGYVAPRLKSLLQKLYRRQSGWPLRNIHISNDNGSLTFYSNVFFPISLPSLFTRHDCIYVQHSGCPTAYPLRAPEFTPRFFCGLIVLSFFFFYYVSRIGQTKDYKIGICCF